MATVLPGIFLFHIHFNTYSCEKVLKITLFLKNKYDRLHVIL